MTANVQAKKSKNTMYYVHSIISLIIMFGFGQLPAVEPLTPLGMNLIGIFLGVLYGWVFIDIVWPSMAGLLALMLIGGMKPKALLNGSFGDPIVVMMFFIFIFRHLAFLFAVPLDQVRNGHAGNTNRQRDLTTATWAIRRRKARRWRCQRFDECARLFRRVNLFFCRREAVSAHAANLLFSEHC